MLVDARGQFLTARAEPRLLQVELSIILARGASLLARHPSMPHPLELSALGPKNAMERSVEVWQDQPRALVCQQGSAWFSGYLNQEVQLVYLGESHLRQVNPAWARVGDLVSFADGYPLLLTNLASLRALNRRLATPVEMGRFRPNVVVDTERAFRRGLLGVTFAGRHSV
jgi:uncharacterized protein YcbX